MAPPPTKCPLPNVHTSYFCIHVSLSGCYSSQQLSQNNILLTTIKFKTFQDYFVNSRISRPWMCSNQIQGFSRLSRPCTNPAEYTHWQGCHSWKLSKFPDFSLTQIFIFPDHASGIIMEMYARFSVVYIMLKLPKQQSWHYYNSQLKNVWYPHF